MSYSDVKLHIYEKFDAGEITELEKTTLLEKLDSEYTLENYCTKLGLIPVDDDNIYFESIRAAIGKFIRDKIDLHEIKKRWNDVASKFTKKWAVKYPNDKELKKLQKSYEKVKQEKISYPEYKMNFNVLAKSVGLPTSDIIIESVAFSKEEGKDKIAIRYSKGKQKVMIPNGTCLMHVSPQKNLPELKPAFRSKTVGKYMYPSPRIFFTLGKEIKPTKAGLEDTKTYKYTPKENFKFGFIDPSYVDFATGSLFIETMNPIAVMDFNEKMKKVYIESAYGMDADILRDKFKVMIFEGELEGKLTHEQSQILLEYVKLIK